MLLASDSISHHSHHRVTLLLIGLNLLITIPLAYHLNIWIDEAYTLNTTQHGVSEAIAQAIQFEYQPPFYFALLSLWRIVNPSILFARLFSVLCIVLTIYSTSLLSRRYLPSIHPAWAVTTVAVHPYTIWAAVELRSYALALLLSALLLILFFDGYVVPRPQASRKMLYALVVVAAFYTHYFLICIPIAQALILLLIKRWTRFLTYLEQMVWVGVALLPMGAVLLTHVLVNSGPALGNSPSSLLSSVRATIGQISLYALSLTADLSLNGSLDSVSRLLRYALLIGLLLLSIRYRRSLPLPHRVLGLMLAVLALLLTLILDLTHTTQLATRYAYCLFLVTILFVFSTLALMPDSNWRSRLLRGWVGLSLATSLLSGIITYSPLAKDGDWQRVANYIMTAEQPGQPIVVFSAESALPLAYYYAGVNPLIPLPQPMGTTDYNLNRLTLQNEAEIWAALASVNPPYDQIWVVNGPDYVIHGTQGVPCTLWGIDLNCPVLEGFIDQHYVMKTRQTFYGSTVRQLHRQAASVERAETARMR